MTVETMPITAPTRTVDHFPTVAAAYDESGPDGQAESSRRREIAIRRWFVFLITAIAIFGATLRVHFLSLPMRYDESYNYVHYASRSIPFILSNYVPNNHILHTLMVHVVTGIFGDSPACLRFPAFVAGVLLFPATAWLTWVLSRQRLASFLAATAVCVSSALIEYSTNARGYSWLALFAVIQFMITVHVMTTKRQRTAWITWAIVGALGAFTVPVMLLWSVSLCVASVVVNCSLKVKSANRRAIMRNSILAMASCAAFTGLLFAPAIFTSGLSGLRATHRMSTDILDRQLPGFGGALICASQLFLRDAGVVWPVFIVFGAAFVSIQAVIRGNREALLAIVATIVAVAAITLFRVPLPARAWLFLWPIAIALSSVGMAFIIDVLISRRVPLDAKGNAPNPFISFVARFGVMSVFAMPLVNVLREPYLVSEPGGLVDVEPAIDTCREFGPPRCTVVSRYTPATAYYLRERKLVDLPLPKDPFVRRIYFVAENSSELAGLWNDRVAGYADYAEPILMTVKSSRSIFVADRREASFDKYPATPREEKH
ncbi:MAG: hypothetical protein HY287_08685 [Planctomycetes bacterium]|nr:hypothetical protein [Planctomycetota bacterium]MBI3834389.1 hypothetical protein [Planctomycetota bacterium]